MAHVLINPPPIKRGDTEQQVDDIRRWLAELQQKLEINFSETDERSENK